MRVIYLGNFGPPHSTENHVKRALEHNGVEVIALQESEFDTWMLMSSHAYLEAQSPAFVLWTRTLWPWHNDTTYRAMLWKALTMCDRAGIPTVGFHLDRWWGLAREHEVHDYPFFRVNLLVTADGGHEEQWADAGIRHHWMPPAVSLGECAPGMFRSEFASDIAFVGSWRGYHPEWRHREELVRWLQDTYGDRVRFWPEPGRDAVRGDDLRDLYASVKVCVGDSCLVPAKGGTPIARYCSDRIPETIGRGGFLVHPWVQGVTTGDDAAWVDNVHLLGWELGDWKQLRHQIDWALADDTERQRIAKAGREHTLIHHTYEQRMFDVVNLVGLL